MRLQSPTFNAVPSDAAESLATESQRLEVGECRSDSQYDNPTIGKQSAGPVT